MMMPAHMAIMILRATLILISDLVMNSKHMEKRSVLEGTWVVFRFIRPVFLLKEYFPSLLLYSPFLNSF